MFWIQSKIGVVKRMIEVACKTKDIEGELLVNNKKSKERPLSTNGIIIIMLRTFWSLHVLFSALVT